MCAGSMFADGASNAGTSTPPSTQTTPLLAPSPGNPSLPHRPFMQSLDVHQASNANLSAASPRTQQAHMHASAADVGQGLPDRPGPMSATAAAAEEGGKDTSRQIEVKNIQVCILIFTFALVHNSSVAQDSAVSRSHICPRAHESVALVLHHFHMPMPACYFGVNHQDVHCCFL
jgi:hypothetical protein